MRYPLFRSAALRRTALRTILVLAVSATVCPADTLGRLEITGTELVPDFQPTTRIYAADISATADTVAAQTLPNHAATRLFIQPAQAPWQEVARGATVAAGGSHCLVLRTDGTLVAWGSNSQGQSTVPPAAQSGVTALAAGQDHNLALREDGSVVAWGYNNSGQTDVPLTAQSGIVAIAAGANHSMALTESGSVIAWGNSTTTQTLPASVSEGIVAIASGDDHALALTSTGEVIAWGNTPQPPPEAGSGVVAIVAGRNRSLALKRDGSVLSWGNTPIANLAVPAAALGAVGLAASDTHNFALRADGSVFVWSEFELGAFAPPASVASGVVAISANRNHAFALKRDGSLITWGTSSSLQNSPLPARHGLRLPASAALPVPYGESQIRLRVASIVTPESSPVPLASLRNRSLSASNGRASVLRADGSVVAWNGATLPGPPANFVAVSTGTFHSLGLTAEGSLHSWGSGSQNLLTAPPDAVDLIAISATSFHSLALRRDGRVLAWGDAPPELIAVPANTSSGVVAISASVNYNLALKADGSVISWGHPAFAAPATASTDIVAVSAGLQNALALKNDGSVVIWGDPSQPVATELPVDAIDLVAISISAGHALALRADGRVVAWGTNTYGQCTVPTEAETEVVSIAAGHDFSLALKSDGTLVNWGAPQSIPTAGQSELLIPSTSASVTITSTPDGLAPRVPLAAGNGFTLALRDTGAAVIWGNLPSSSLQPPANASAFVALAARENYVLGLKPDGSVTGWGQADDGQLSIPVAAQSRVVALAAGHRHSLALKRDGSVVAWGSNASGQSTVPELNPPTTASNGYVFTAIAAAENTSFGLRSDGRVIAWGSSTYNLTTVPVAAQSEVIAIAAGYQHALALKRDGSVVGWGNSFAGINGVFTPPVPIVALAAGDAYSVFLHADGTVSGTGANNFFVPATASGGAVALAAGRNHATVLKADGTLVSWGGMSASAPHPLTVLRPGPPGDDYAVTLSRAYPDPTLSALSLSSGTLSPTFAPTTTSYRHTTPLDLAGLAVDFAPASFGASVQMRINGAEPRTLLSGPTVLIHPGSGDILGLDARGAFTSNNSILTNPANLPAAAREGLIALGHANNLLVGLRQEGSLVAWFLGSANEQPVPSALSSGGITQIASAESEILALHRDGSVFAWSPGNPSLGFVPLEAQSGVAHIAAHRSTRLALLADGSVRAWGNIAPPPPEASSEVVSIHAGDGLAFAQKADGSLVLWGNHHPSLADFPAAVLTKGIVSILAQYDNAQALLADGYVVSWGSSSADFAAPQNARTGVVALTGNEQLRLAQKFDGSVVRWNPFANAESLTLSLGLPRSAPLPLRYGDNRISLRITPKGPTLSGAPIATGPRGHYAVTPEGAVIFRPSFSGASTPFLPIESQSGIVSVYSGGYGDYALTSGGGLIRLFGPSVPFDARPTRSGQTPVHAPITSVAIGESFVVVLRTDGTTYQWGNLPAAPADAQKDVVAIAAGNNHVLALRTDGRVIHWDDSSNQNRAPREATSDVVAIAASYNTSLALKADGTVVSWFLISPDTPSPEVLSDAVGIAVGMDQALALRADGSVFAWGYGASISPPPASVASGVIDLFAYGRQVVALKADGTTVTWGRTLGGGQILPADFGRPLLGAPARDYHLTITRPLPPPALAQLGAAGSGLLTPNFTPDTLSYTLPPTPYPALAPHARPLFSSGELAVRAGASTFAARLAGPTIATTNGALLAIRPDGTLRTFGDGSTAYPPAQAQGALVAVVAGHDHAFALRQNGSLVGWGNDSHQQLSTLPVGNDFSAVASGSYHGLALRNDGSIVAWGRDFEQQLRVPDTATDIVAIAAGEYTSMALRRDGAVVAWGRSSQTPQPIPADAQSGVVAIAAGRDHYLALRADGRTVQWGNVSSFIAPPPFRLIAIAAAGDHNMGLRPNGELATWGSYQSNATAPRLDFGNFTNVTAFAMGPAFSATLRSDGSLVVIDGQSTGPSHLNGGAEFSGPYALPLSARVPLAIGENTVEIRITRPNTEPPLVITYALNVTRDPAPEFRLVPGTDLATDQPYFHDFGPLAVGTTSAAQTFTVHNSGTAELIVSSHRLSGSQTADFAIAGLPAAFTLAPNARLEFTATATPSTAGFRLGSLVFETNQPNAEPAGFSLGTTGLTVASEIAAWRARQFTPEQLADPELEATVWGTLADPDGDGLPNLLEYALGLDATTASPATTALIMEEEPGDPETPRVLTLTYTRLKRAVLAGMIYRIEVSDTLAPGSWAPLNAQEQLVADDGTTETIAVSTSAAGPARFLRLNVTAP